MREGQEGLVWRYERSIFREPPSHDVDKSFGSVQIITDEHEIINVP